MKWLLSILVLYLYFCLVFVDHIQSVYWLIISILQCSSYAKPQKQVGSYCSSCKQQVNWLPDAALLWCYLCTYS